jgi:hypothetical protein
VSYFLLVLITVAKIDVKDNTVGQLYAGSDTTVLLARIAFAITGILDF